MENTKILQDSNSMIRTDVTLLFIQARNYASMLFRRISENKPIKDVYFDFVEVFFQLYLIFKHNAEQTGLVKDFEEKIKKLDDLFYNKIMQGKIVKNILLYFDAFAKDLVRCGIYNLTYADYKDIV